MITLTGAERRAWLHALSTQDVAEMPDGSCTENLSLDGQGRVEDHWMQTELGGVTYLDTEPWRGEPLLAYLQKMVFWSDVQPAEADFAVLSLIGPGLSAPAVLAELGLDAVPGEATAVALPGGTERVVEGTIEGVLTRERRGGNGFGYDPIFVPLGYQVTTAEMTAEEKDAISHRGQAMRALAPVLRQLLPH